MITINFALQKPGRDHSSFKSGFIGAVLSILLIGVFGGLFSFLLSEAEVAEKMRDSQREFLDDLKEKVGEAADLEAMAKGVQAQLIKVAQLRRSKRGPVRLLDDIANALPVRAWLAELSQKENSLKIAGRALDNPTISEFMVKLNASKWVRSVELKESRQEDREGVRIQGFTLEVDLIPAGKREGP